MTYRVLGEGHPLILVPGIASTYRTYALLLNLLAEQFRTVVYEYPGEDQDDCSRLREIGHDDLVDDLLGLIDHLGFGRALLLGVSFGSTIVLKALSRQPDRFPKAVAQGAFARRAFSRAERWALGLGQLVPGTVKRLPLRATVLTYNSKAEFPAILQDRWALYLEEDGLTPIRSLAHRVKLLMALDLEPILAQISTEILLIQGNEDRIVPARYFEALKAGLPRAEGIVLPTVGHLPHLTHAEIMARVITEWLLPGQVNGCAVAGCTQEHRLRADCGAAFCPFD
jgi:pimeloyl-ACP methyl ester carboxylesterase